MPIICTIGGVDVSEHLKHPLITRPGGDGLLGGAQLILDQQAGGMDLRTMMDVRVWKTFNDAGDGIESRGRLFGGLVQKRDTTNVATTKKWTLICWDYNVILKKTVRRAAEVYAITLDAGTFAEQVLQLMTIVTEAGNGPPLLPIEATEKVTITEAMPSVTYPGGKTLEWYLQQLCKKVHQLDDTIVPAFYLGTGDGFGIAETFGPPVLYLYNANTTGTSVMSFSDTPTGGQKSVFPEFRRITEASEMVQFQQVRWTGTGGNLIYTAQNDDSIDTYPNNYINDNGDGYGPWAAEAIDDSESTTAEEAQAVADRVILAKGAPRDTFVWDTYERLLAGETIDLKWDLEGIPADTLMRIAAAEYTWEEPDKIRSKLTLNTRLLGLFDDGTEGIFAPPIEGDHSPPLPPADFDVTANTYNQTLDVAEMTFDIDPSPSPDAAGYKIHGRIDLTELYEEDVEDDLTPTLRFPPGVSYSLQAFTYDNAGNNSGNTPVSPLTGTTALRVIEPPTGFQEDTSYGSGGYVWENGGQAKLAVEFTPPSILPDYYTVDVLHATLPPQTYEIPADKTGTIIPHLIAEEDYTLRLRAWDWGWPSAPVTLDITVPAYTPPDAPTVAVPDTGVDDLGPYAEVTVTHTGDHSGGGNIFWQRSGASPDEPIYSIAIPRNWASPYTTLVREGLVVGASYDFTATVKDALGVENETPSNTVSVTITYAPDPPEITGITSGRDSHGNYYATLTIDHPDEPIWGGWVYYQITAGGIPGPGPLYQWPIVRNPDSWPVTVTVFNGIVAGATFRFWATVFDAHGIESPLSDPEDETIGLLRERNVPNSGFEDGDALDATLPAGWLRLVGGTSTVERTNTDKYSGEWSVRLTRDGSNDCDLYDGRFFSPPEGGNIFVRFAAKAASGTPDVDLRWHTHSLPEGGGDTDEFPIGTVTLSTDWEIYEVPVTSDAYYSDAYSSIQFTPEAGADIYLDAVEVYQYALRTGAGLMSPADKSNLDALTLITAGGDETSLIDRARMAPGWRSLGLLTNEAFRESDITYVDGTYYVFSTQDYETLKTCVRSASTPEGIVSATPTNDIAPVKYPSVVYDTETGIWHLWGTNTSGSVRTSHYTATAPTGTYTFSDDIDDVLIIDTQVRKHPTNGYWYAIGFTNVADSALRILRADAPEGPWTDMGDVFADTGEPPFASTSRPDPNLALGVGGRNYIFYTGAPPTILGTTGNYPSIQEIDIDTCRVKGAPVVLVDEREAWMIDGASSPYYFFSDLSFLRVEGQPDRIFGYSNDNGNTANWGWGCLDLARVVTPSDGRRDNDLVRLDMRRGLDVASGIRPTLITGGAFSQRGLAVTTSGGGAYGYPALSKLTDFTLQVEFEPHTIAAGANNTIAFVGGADYAGGPYLHVFIATDGTLKAEIDGDSGSAVTLTTGITPSLGTRYAVVFRKAGTEVKLWVNGTLSDTDTHSVNLTGLQVWSAGVQKTLTQAARYPFMGVVRSLALVGGILPQSSVKQYTTDTAKEFVPGIFVSKGGEIEFRRDLTDSSDRRNWVWVSEVAAAGDFHLRRSSTNTGEPSTNTVMAFDKDGNLTTLSTIAAAGDLLAGTANDQIGRLSVGADKYVLTADSVAATGLAWKPLTTHTGLQGTSFPGSPSSGMMFFRTDLGVWCYYDGTRWLEAFEMSVAWWLDRENAAFPFTFSGSTGGDQAGPKCRFPSNRDSYIIRLDLDYYVGGTHNGSNYWTIKCERHTNAAGFTTIGTFDTNKSTGSAYVLMTKNTADFSNAVVPGNDHWLKIIATKTGTPGNLSITPELYFRGIRT